MALHREVSETQFLLGACRAHRFIAMIMGSLAMARQPELWTEGRFCASRDQEGAQRVERPEREVHDARYTDRVREANTGEGLAPAGSQSIKDVGQHRGL
jgi:hypothetical protein